MFFSLFIYYFALCFVPPLMRPFVLIADIDKDVIVVTTVVVRINKIPWPAMSTLVLKNLIKPRNEMTQRHGTYRLLFAPRPRRAARTASHPRC